MERGAVIVTGRGFPIWCGAVPELAAYENICRIKSRNAAITEGNTVGFKLIENALSLLAENAGSALDTTAAAI